MEGECQSLSNLWRELVHVTSLHCFCVVYFNCCSNFVLLIVVSLMTRFHFPLLSYTYTVKPLSIISEKTVQRK